MSRLLMVLFWCVLAGCNPHNPLLLVPQGGEVPEAETVFVATSRAIDPETQTFSSKRAEEPSFARYVISVPENREAGSIAYARLGAKPNPKRNFATTSAVLYADGPAFRKDLAAALSEEDQTGREATIFVHGFNTTFAEGVYRVAQLAHDLELPGVAMHYAWPSAATPLGYVYDRDSVDFSRNGLEDMLREVSNSGADRIYLVAQSMGSYLVVESLRQLAFRGDQKTLAKIAGVILIAPDIDVEVFRSQARDIGHLPQPFMIFSSERDQILQMSAALTGQKARLGSLSSVAAVSDLDVTLVDVAAFNKGAGHFNVGNSSALIRLLNRIDEVDAAFASRAGTKGGPRQQVQYVRNARQVTLAPDPLDRPSRQR